MLKKLIALVFVVLIAYSLIPKEKIDAEVYASYDDKGKYIYIRFPEEVFVKKIIVGGEEFDVYERLKEYKLYFNYRPMRYVVNIETGKGSVKKVVKAENIVKAEVKNETLIEVFSIGYDKVMIFSYDDLPTVYARGCDYEVLRKAGFRILTAVRNDTIILVCNQPLPYEYRNLTVYAVNPKKYYVDRDGRAYFVEIKYIPLKEVADLLKIYGQLEIYNLEGDARRIYFIPKHRNVAVLFKKGWSWKVIKAVYEKNLSGSMILIEDPKAGWNTVKVSQGNYIQVLPAGSFCEIKNHEANVFLEEGENVLVLYGGENIVDALKVEVEPYKVKVEKKAGKYYIFVNGNLTAVRSDLPRYIEVNGYPVKLPYYKAEIPAEYIAGIAIAFISFLIYIFTKPAEFKGNQYVKVIFEEEKEVEIPDNFIKEIFGEHALTLYEIYEEYAKRYEEVPIELFGKKLKEKLNEYKEYYHPKDVKTAYLLRKARDWLVMNGYLFYQGKYFKDGEFYEVGLVVNKEDIFQYFDKENVIIFALEELKEELRVYEGFEIVFV